MNLCFLCLSPRVPVLIYRGIDKWLNTRTSLPAKGGLLCLLVLLYNFGYVSLSKIVASRARRCALFRLASAKVRRGFELAKLSGNIFSKILLTGWFWRVRVAIRGDKRGSEGRGGPRSGTSGNGGEGRKTEGGARRDGGGRAAAMDGHKS